MEYKQPTYLIFAKNETERYAILRSSLALVKNWKKGCFEIPLNMLEEFRIAFGRGSSLESSHCKYMITKKEIDDLNLISLENTDHNIAQSPIATLKNYLENLENVSHVVLVDKSTKSEINVGMKDGSFYMFYGNNCENINKLLNSFIDKLDVLDVSNEKISVDLVKIFNDKDIIQQAAKSISKTYGLVKNQDIAAWQLAYDTAYYMSIGADKFCGRVLETLEFAHKQKEWVPEEKQEETLKYFIISVSKGITAGEGYDICLEMDNFANARDAIDKAIEDCLFAEPEDVNNILSVEKVDAKTYQKLKGYNSLDKRIVEASKRKTNTAEQETVRSEPVK